MVILYEIDNNYFQLAEARYKLFIRQLRLF